MLAFSLSLVFSLCWTFMLFYNVMLLTTWNLAQVAVVNSSVLVFCLINPFRRCVLRQWFVELSQFSSHDNRPYFSHSVWFRYHTNCMYRDAAVYFRFLIKLYLPIATGVGRVFSRVCLCVCLSVGLFFRTLKGKRLELLTPNLVHIYSIAVAWHALTRRSKGQRSRSHGYENCRCRMVASDACCYGCVLLRHGSACRYDCLCFLVLYFFVLLWCFLSECLQMQLKDYHFSHHFKQACQRSVLDLCSSGHRDAMMSKWVLLSCIDSILPVTAHQHHRTRVWWCCCCCC